MGGSFDSRVRDEEGSGKNGNLGTWEMLPQYLKCRIHSASLIQPGMSMIKWVVLVGQSVQMPSSHYENNVTPPDSFFLLCFAFISQLVLLTLLAPSDGQGTQWAQLGPLSKLFYGAKYYKI